MTNALKTSLGCLFIALALNAASQQLVLPMVTAAPAQNNPGEDPWLQLNCHNPAKNQRLTPRWTVIVSSVKPTVRQIRENRWEIEFNP